MNRREALRVLGIGTLAVGGAMLFDGQKKDSTWGIEFDKDPELNFEEAMQLSLRFDRVADKITPIEPDTSPEGLVKYATEIIPQFEYEGIVPRSAFPDNLAYVWFYNDSQAHNHVMGRSDCQSFVILNERVANERSSWFGNDLVFSLTHELAHVAQGRTKEGCGQNRELVETSAQIGALEVASGLALGGNREFFNAVVDEVRGMAISSAYDLSLEGNQFDKFLQLRDQLSPGAVSEARFERSRRRWADDPQQLRFILNAYNTQPLNMLIHAISYNDGKIEGLAFPEQHFFQQGSIYSYLENPLPIKLDDTAYLIRHMEALARDFEKEIL